MSVEFGLTPTEVVCTLPALLLQVYVLAVPPYKVVLCPEQILVLPLMLRVGVGVTVTVTDFFIGQALSYVLTEYVVVPTAGLKLTVEVVALPALVLQV